MRCRDTAACYGDKVVIDPKLCEYQGHKNLKSFKLESFTAKYDVPDSEETWDQFTKRVDKHLEELTTRYEEREPMQLEGSVLVVTHGIVVKYLQEQLLAKSPYKRAREVPYGQGFAVIFEEDEED